MSPMLDSTNQNYAFSFLHNKTTECYSFTCPLTLQPCPSLKSRDQPLITSYSHSACAVYNQMYVGVVGLGFFWGVGFCLFLKSIGKAGKRFQ